MDVSNSEFLKEKRRKRMAIIDAMPAELRRLVNEYGYNVVHTLMNVGVRKPNQIEHVVETILDEFSPTRGSFSRQGIRTEVQMDQPKP